MKPFHYLLLPGHGTRHPETGEPVTAGKRSPVLPDGSQLIEGEFNRAVMQRTGELLDKAGVPYTYIIPPAEWQDVKPGVRIAEANAAALTVQNEGQRPILVDIHANAAGNGVDWHPAKGFEAFTYEGTNEADVLATHIYEAYGRGFDIKDARKNYADGDPDKETNLFYILRRTSMPAVLVEMAFMTNRVECELMLSEEGVQRFASVLANGIISHYKATAIDES